MKQRVAETKRARKRETQPIFTHIDILPLLYPSTVANSSTPSPAVFLFDIPSAEEIHFRGTKKKYRRKINGSLPLDGSCAKSRSRLVEAPRGRGLKMSSRCVIAYIDHALLAYRTALPVKYIECEVPKGFLL